MISIKQIKIDFYYYLKLKININKILNKNSYNV